MTHSTREQDLAAKERFEADTDGHQMTVLRDDGLYRHLRFAKPDNGFYWFEVVTWPGTLVLNGDMGCWTFRRIEDMFEFFRDSRGLTRINPGYWAEKLVNGDSGGYKAAQKYDGDYYVSQVNETITEFLEHGKGEDWPDDVKARLRADVAEVFEDAWGNRPPGSADLAIAELAEFRFAARATHPAPKTMADTLGTSKSMMVEYGPTYRFQFTDPWEWDLEQPTIHYLWSCWAIVHAIAAYDAREAEEVAALATSVDRLREKVGGTR